MDWVRRGLAGGEPPNCTFVYTPRGSWVLRCPRLPSRHVRLFFRKGGSPGRGRRSTILRDAAFRQTRPALARYGCDARGSESAEGTRSRPSGSGTLRPIKRCFPTDPRIPGFSRRSSPSSGGRDDRRAQRLELAPGCEGGVSSRRSAVKGVGSWHALPQRTRTRGRCGGSRRRRPQRRPNEATFVLDSCAG